MGKKRSIKDRTKERIFNFLSIVFEAIIGIAIGIILYLIGIKNDAEWADMCVTVGQLFISVSAGSLLLEWFGYVNYTRKRMCEVLAENDVLNVLTTARKKELKTALLNNLYMPDKNLGYNNIVEVMDNEMDNILKDFYYKEYIMYVDISIVEIDGVKYIKKEIRKTYDAETINNKMCYIGRLLEIQINPTKGDDTVTLESLHINGEKIKDIKLQTRLQTEDNCDEVENHYDTTFYLEIEDLKNKLRFDDKISIDIKYSTITDISDKVFSHQIEKPCKHYCIHFNYEANIELDIVGFGFMTVGDKNKKRVVKTQNGHMLRFLTWILPGDGVMAAITVKDE